MRSSKDKVSKSDDNSDLDTESKAQTTRHLHIINMINNAREALPDLPCLSLTRTLGMSVSPPSPIVYMKKHNGELFFDQGQYENLANNPEFANLGKNPIPCISKYAPQAFRAELSCAFFAREVKRIVRESTPINNDLINIIVKYM